MVGKLRPSFTFTEDRMKELKAVVPEAFADGKINWEVLQEVLGEYLEEEGTERFGLFWPGKREARRLASLPGKGTLVPVPGEGVYENTTRNIFIEGENLEVLKILLKSYEGRVKLIYIDPPYNTGNDAVYMDDYSEPLQAYLARTGQLGDDEGLLTTNPKASGRYHSRWLSMMYPRLVIARRFLSHDGVILISIDDNEFERLKQVCGEVFGEENFIGTFVWETKRAARGVPPNTLLMSNHEYVVCCAFDASNVRFRGLERDEEDFGNPDNDPRGLWRSESIRATGSQDNYFTIIDPATGHGFYGNWAFSESTIGQMIEGDLILFPPDPEGTPRQKKFIDSYTYDRKAGVTSLGWHSTERSTKELMDLFQGRKVFDFPKPLSLIGYFCEQVLGEDDLAMDFFAGSCTTAHSLLARNVKKDAVCRFVMVQMPEPTKPASLAAQIGLNTVAEIGKERIRLAIDRLREDVEGRAGSDSELRSLGFKVYKLVRSHFLEWHDFQGGDLTRYQIALSEHSDTPLIDEWEPIHLLGEIMLNQGFQLDSKVTTLEELRSNTVYRIESEFCEFSLHVCLDERIGQQSIETLLNLSRDDLFVCLDSALTDEIKMRLDDAINLYVI